ncbi:hypothetical protein K3495_g4626 [Podosphaera aphanis]|nr:hypothetical protein K3495_g4626 [Podosphaera aphanis]
MTNSEPHALQHQCQCSHYAVSQSTSTAPKSADNQGSKGYLKLPKAFNLEQNLCESKTNTLLPLVLTSQAKRSYFAPQNTSSHPSLCPSSLNTISLQNHQYMTTRTDSSLSMDIARKTLNEYNKSFSNSTDTSSVDSSYSQRTISSGVCNTPDYDSASSFLLSLQIPNPNDIVTMTPLPSPTESGNSSESWEEKNSSSIIQGHQASISVDSVLVTRNGESISSAITNQQKRRTYQDLLINTDNSPLKVLRDNEKDITGINTLNRIQGGYEKVFKDITIKDSNNIAPFLESIPSDMNSYTIWKPNTPTEGKLRPTPRPPTPPSSRMGCEGSDCDSSIPTTPVLRAHTKPKQEPQIEIFEAHSREDMKLRRWRFLKPLGEGTFSKVILATSQISCDDSQVNLLEPLQQSISSTASIPEDSDRKKLVAVKICEYGQKGGFSEERVERAFKRELEFMKIICHPSLVRLKAWNIEKTRTILILDYCPGGDLFEIASEHHNLLVPSLLRRIFSELVAAVRYLHDRHIVHRDIKLENVLVNLSQNELSQHRNWNIYPYSIITLTDLGLSRQITDDEKLKTRCGSDDYAAPEVIMGQEYDGRATDAWSLGVLLYALLESHLPFDPIPGTSEDYKQRSRTSHRIARVEWCWVEYAGTENEHEGDPEKFRNRGLEGAMLVTEGLLKRARSRWTLQQVAETEWVRDAVQLEGGIRFRGEDNSESIVVA